MIHANSIYISPIKTYLKDKEYMGVSKNRATSKWMVYEGKHY